MTVETNAPGRVAWTCPSCGSPEQSGATCEACGVAAPGPVGRLAPGLARTGVVPDRARLVILSFLMLFVELALIRWAGSNIVYLSYFSNFVLLGSFLGIGLGFLRARSRRDLSGWAPAVLGLFVTLVWFLPIRITQDDPSVFFFSTLTPRGPPRDVVLALVFLFSAGILMLISEGVARTFARFDNLDAYKYDLFGSILGIAAFSAVAFLELPPLAWGIVVALAFVALGLPRVPSLPVLAGSAALVVVLALEAASPHVQWSPYYKVKAEPNAGMEGNLAISVNGVAHQQHQPASSAPGNRLYRVLPNQKLDEVLVIGAGGGNDVAVALDKGAKHVDAVEIDPVLARLGKDHHPDKPYDDPRVDLYINDGRAFMERTNHTYDLIVLALPDSITLLSGQSALRLESYLFTKEAMQSAKALLRPGGTFAMYNYYRYDWLIDRYGGTLEQVYGHRPCLDTLAAKLGPKGIALDAFVATATPERLDCTAGQEAQVWAPRGTVPPPATDDHPYPYLRTRTIPPLYLISLGLILAFSVVAILLAANVGAAGTGGARGMLQYADLFFMGVAFLLLETKNVVQFALLFGTTWFVNALVFAGVLASVLVAVAVSRRVTFRHPERLYGVLLASLVVAFVLPSSLLLDLPLVPRFLAAVAVAFAPVFTANLVFTQRFKGTGDSTTAFGANLLGSMVGGVLEYLALITGYRVLLIVVAVLYGLAFAFGRRHLVAGGAAPAEVP
jgi:SAM-dependent methyltransferase